MRTGMNPLGFADDFAHTFDAKGWVMSWANGLKEEDYIDLQYDENAKQKLQKQLKRIPPKKKWVNAQVMLNGKYQKAKIKYHGTSSAHYQDGKYSYTVKMSLESDFPDRMRAFKLIKGEEAAPTLAGANRLAGELGLIAPWGRMVILRINGKEMGHYYMVEHLQKEYLEREFGITNYTILVNKNDWTRKDVHLTGANHISHHDLYHGHLEADDDELHARGVGMYKVLAQHIQNRDVAAVKSMIDEDYCARFLALQSLFNDVHFTTGDNLKLIYDFSRGRFFPLYRQEVLGHKLSWFEPNALYQNTFPNYNNLLFRSQVNYRSSVNADFFKLLLSDDDFRNQRDKHLWRLTEKAQDILKTLQETYATNRPVMLHSNISRRQYHFLKKDQLEIFQNMSRLARQYLSYGHVYGSYDRKAGKLHLIADAYAQLEVSIKDTNLLRKKLQGISFDMEQNHQYNYETIDLQLDSFNLKRLVFVNTITGDTLDRVYINEIDSKALPMPFDTEAELQQAGIRYEIDGSRLAIKAGTYQLLNDLRIASHYETEIAAGTHFILDSGVNVLIYGPLEAIGTAKRPITITKLQNTTAFGTFAVIGQGRETQVNLNHVHVAGGGESYVDGRIFTGQFAVYHATASIRNCSFTESYGDDGLNVKYADVEIDSCIFRRNKADQVDLDFCNAYVHRCQFATARADANGDGLDLSGSDALVEACQFEDFPDKALSVGEHTTILVTRNHFSKNQRGIAAKDDSHVYCWQNQFEENRYRYAMYLKKKLFAEPHLYLVTEPDTSKFFRLEGELELVKENTLTEKRKAFLSGF